MAKKPRSNSSTRYILKFLAAGLCLLFNELSAQTTPDIFIRTFATNDSVLLRWVPANVETWRAGNKSGYWIERYTADAFLDLSGQDPTGKGTAINAAPLLPLAKNDTSWKSLLQKDPLNAVVFDALYGATTKSNSTEEKLQFGFALKACDLSPAVAKAHGLFFCDRTVQSGQVYVYRIRLAAPTGKHAPGIATADKNLSRLVAPSKPEADFRNRKATLSFDAVSTRSMYAGYIIERSEDSIHFSRVNATLLVFAVSQYEANKTVLVYRDSFPQNNKTYWYRISGFSYFGITGPPSARIKGRGKDDWLVYPVIDTLFSPDNKRAELKWHLSDTAAALKNFLILRAPAVNGPFLPVSAVLEKSATTFTDGQPQFTNYYLACAISANADTGFSYPHLLQLEDNEPPPAPVKLTGVIDTNGVVQLSWPAVAANDLKGYRVFRCNSLREEFYEISDSILPGTRFTDTITLHTLTRDVYYCVQSVDRMYNNSQPSEPCKLKRPDKIAPVAPVVRFAVHTDSTIRLGWINSSSDDIQCVELKRNDGVSLACWNGKDTITHFTDAIIVPGNTYTYTLVVTDSSGNRSSAVFPAVQFQPRIYPPLKNVAAVPDFEKRIVTLSWNAAQQPVDRYVIYKAKKGEAFRSWKTVDGKTSIVADKEVYPGNEYVYKVKAVMKSGAETQLVEVNVSF